MSFDQTKMALISSGWAGFVSRLWSFENVDGDDFSVVASSNYFLDAFEKLANGDRIVIRTGDSTYELTVTKTGTILLNPTINTTLSAGGLLLQTQFADISVLTPNFVAVPNGVGGTLAAMSAVLGGPITGSDEIIAFGNNGVLMGQLIVPVAGSGTGIQTTQFVPQIPANTLSNIFPGSSIEIETTGVSTGPATGFASALFI